MPKRIQRRRTKGWKMPRNTISVTRPGRWGNEFKVDDYTPDRKECIRAFKEKKLEQQREYPEWFEEYYLKPIRGKDLACWCKLSDECHGNFWLELANKES